MQTTTEPIIRTYPTISQSLEIAGILIMAKVLVSLVNFRLGEILGEETTMLLYYVLSIGIPFWVVNTIRKKITGESSFVLTVNNPRIIPLIIVVTLALLFGIISPLGSLIPIPDSFKETFRTMAGQTGILSFILIVIVAPVLEELIFRGIMLDGLLKKYTPMRSIMISSLLFGFVHLNPWQFIAGFVIGIFCGWVYYKTQSLMPAIIIHAAANLSGFSVRVFADIDSVLDDTIYDLYGNITNLAAVVISSIIIIWICVFFLKRELIKEEAKTLSSGLAGE